MIYFLTGFQDSKSLDDKFSNIYLKYTQLELQYKIS